MSLETLRNNALGRAIQDPLGIRMRHSEHISRCSWSRYTRHSVHNIKLQFMWRPDKGDQNPLQKDNHNMGWSNTNSCRNRCQYRHKDHSEHVTIVGGSNRVISSIANMEALGFSQLVACEIAQNLIQRITDHSDGDVKSTARPAASVCINLRAKILRHTRPLDEKAQPCADHDPDNVFVPGGSNSAVR